MFAQEIVSGLDSEDIGHSGERTTEQLLRDLPLANANSVPLSNSAANPTRGASSISLRGMDPGDTLVLVNFRRVAPYPVGAGFTQPFVDLYSIPLAGIESIDLLKGGSTAIHGANAVAGTVNLVLRQNYRGAETTTEYGNALDKDSSEWSASLVFGVGNEDTNVSGFVDYYHRNSIFNRDRGYSAKPPGLSPNTSPFILQVSSAVALAAGGSPHFSTLTFAQAPSFTNGTAPASNYVYDANRKNLFNPNQFTGSFPESERYGGYVNFEHEVFGNQSMVVYGDAFYQNVKTRNELAPPPTGYFQSDGQTTLAIPPRTPIAPGLEPPYTPTHAETGVPANAFNPFNPFNQIISGSTRARLAEFGNQIFRNETDAFFSTIGIKGDGFVNGTWGYDAAFRYSQVKNTETRNGVSASRFNRILNAADPIFDPASSEFIGTTIPYNPFGDFRVPIPSNAPSIAFATVRPKEVDTSKLATIDLNIYTTQLLKLPAGGVGFAFGGQFRRETLSQVPDTLILEKDLIGQTARFFSSVPNSPIISPDPFTNANRTVLALYAETDIPIFSTENAILGFHDLSFKVAGRFEDWRNNDTNAAVPDLGLRWNPFDNSFTIRVNWQEGFREPSLQELYQTSQSAIIDLFPSLPFETPFPTRVPFRVKSNPNLQPERSRSFNAGFDYSPKFLPGLTLSADLFDVEITGRINMNPSPKEIVTRFNSGKLHPGEAVLFENGDISLVQGIFTNDGREQARGIDLAAEYKVKTSFGEFASRTEATYLDSFRLAESAGDRAPELSSRPSDDFSNEGYIKWKGRSDLTWSWNGFDITGTVRYTGGFREQFLNSIQFGGTSPGKFHWVDATWFFDVQGSYELTFVSPVEPQPVPGYSKGAAEVARGKDGKAIETGQTANYSIPCWRNLLNNTTITVGCNNLLGQDPPNALGFLSGNSINYPGFLYDATGRFVYARLTKTF